MKVEEISSDGLKTLWEKGEITRSEQSLLFPRRFQANYTADTYKTGLVWERVKKKPIFMVEYLNIPFYHITTLVSQVI